MMLPSPRIFRSRWAALVWAGGVLWAAVEIAGSAPTPPRHDSQVRAAPSAEGTDATGQAATSDDLAVIANAMGQ